jgi:transmembrane sensor
MRNPWPQRRWVVPAIATTLAVAAVLLVATTLSVRRPSELWREYATTRGQRQHMTLADGTELALAPASRVRLRADYGAKRRDVYLVQGEAYVSVAHDAAHPFVLYARNVAARDVGTRYAVRAYPTDSVVRVVIAEGAVAVGDTSARTPSAPRTSGMLVDVDRAGRERVSAGVRVDDYIGWTAGRLAFTAEPLGEVVEDLSRWYDLDLRVGDARLAARRVTLTVTDAPAGDVLSGLAAELGARIERHGRVAVLRAGASAR